MIVFLAVLLCVCVLAARGLTLHLVELVRGYGLDEQNRWVVGYSHGATERRCVVERSKKQPSPTFDDMASTAHHWRLLSR